MSSEVARHPETSPVATLQSLVVAFVLAMTFRGFVTEGFVIPTGSMAPTLMGEHLDLRSEQTGYSFAVDSQGRGSSYPVFDPMLGRANTLAGVSPRTTRPRMGDRILVLKSLYPFSRPDRFDVVVFKNPTDPDGDAENYIKRLVGLPDEAVWLVDGDVFVAPADDCDDLEAFRVQRKPEYVQRAVWQPVHHSDFVPLSPASLAPPWSAPWSGAGWDTSGRDYRCDTADPSVLAWDGVRWPITDWTAYNMLRPNANDNRTVSDVRVAAGLVADAEGLATTLELGARGHLYRFTIAGGEARMTVSRRTERGDVPVAETTYELDPPAPGRVYDVEFWHVDQSMKIFVDGDLAGPTLEYDWRPTDRIENAFGMPLESWRQRQAWNQNAPPMEIEWRFEGSAVTMHRVQVDRDLHYRAARLGRAAGTIRVGGQSLSNPVMAGYEELVRVGGNGFGTHPDKPARLGPDHYFMLGDNSPASSDSRLWGMPHPYVATQIDPSPFVVPGKLLLGKAWVVYFPAPYPLRENGRGIVPNFGRLRFIR